jgi:hypothetical protein
MLRTVLDAIPAAVFIVDNDVRIMVANRAAHELMGSSRPSWSMPLRAGEALQCLHAGRQPDGCGHSPDCKDCVIRNAVREALAGRRSLRLRSRMHLHLDGRACDAYLQITASGFDYQGHDWALLVLEDISEFAELRKIVPICAQCKKIRQDEDFWQSVETYVGRHLDLSFSHSYCPACKEDILRSVDAVSLVPKGGPSSIAG